jgi:hypothetical protein
VPTSNAAKVTTTATAAKVTTDRFADSLVPGSVASLLCCEEQFNPAKHLGRSRCARANGHLVGGAIHRLTNHRQFFLHKLPDGIVRGAFTDQVFDVNVAFLAETCYGPRGTG